MATLTSTLSSDQPVHLLGNKARVLFVSVFGPYAQDDAYGSRKINPMELYHNQVTRVQHGFSLRTFNRSWGLMLMQVNLDAPCTLLDFPTEERFVEELKSQEYDVIGVSSIMTNLLKVRRMCKLIRKHQPQATIVVGGHIANLPALGKYADVDHIVQGDGVRWMRRFLGEDESSPIRHPVVRANIGTQIMAKGYHFPMLTLVGVIDADLGLSGGDPRAAERTWQQLEQVAGRAGRAERPGRVIFQSYAPEHPVIAALISGDGQAFLEQEAFDREQQMLPPFGKLAAIIVSGADFNAVAKTARRIAVLAPKDKAITVLGPVPAPMAYLRGKNRFRLLIKAEKQVKLQKIMGQWLSSCPLERGVSLQVDIDPYSFF